MKKELKEKLELKKSTVTCLNHLELLNVFGGETTECVPTDELTTVEDCGKPILW